LTVGYPFLGRVAGVFKSLDGGSTWQRTALEKDLGVSEIAVNPRFPEILYAATDQGLAVLPLLPRGVGRGREKRDGVMRVWGGGARSRVNAYGP
jgi:hypothetical protein